MPEKKLSGSFEFSAKIWLWNNGKSPASWHFVNVPRDISQQIKKISATMPKKWRWSMKIRARIWFFSRVTSIFPEGKTGTYLLPIKAEVRHELHIQADDEVLLYLDILC